MTFKILPDHSRLVRIQLIVRSFLYAVTLPDGCCYSLALGGPTLNSIHRAVYNYITREPLGRIDSGDLPDPELKKQVENVSSHVKKLPSQAK